MICNPRIGQTVRLWYSARWISFGASYHGLVGTVEGRSRGPGPRNHTVRVGGVLVVVPCGNLQTVKETTE